MVMGLPTWKNTTVLLLGVAALPTILGVACAASTPVGPTAATSVPPPRATVAPLPAGAPTPTIAPARSPAPFPAVPPLPTALPARPVEEPPAVSGLLTYMITFGRDLQFLSRDAPTTSDLVSTAQQLSVVTIWVNQEIGGMSRLQQEQALRDVSYLLDTMSRVVESQIGESGGAGPTSPQGTPQPTSGTLLTILPGALPPGPPSALPFLTQQLGEQINLVGQQAAAASKGHPTGGEIVVLLRSLEASETTLYQQASLLSSQDLSSLTAATAAAMQQVSNAVRAYATGS